MKKPTYSGGFDFLETQRVVVSSSRNKINASDRQLTEVLF
jgi:hypothetical protein